MTKKINNSMLAVVLFSTASVLTVSTVQAVDWGGQSGNVVVTPGGRTTVGGLINNIANTANGRTGNRGSYGGGNPDGTAYMGVQQPAGVYGQQQEAVPYAEQPICATNHLWHHQYGLRTTNERSNIEVAVCLEFQPGSKNYGKPNKVINPSTGQAMMIDARNVHIEWEDFGRPGSTDLRDVVKPGATNIRNPDHVSAYSLDGGNGMSVVEMPADTVAVDDANRAFRQEEAGLETKLNAMKQPTRQQLPAHLQNKIDQLYRDLRAGKQPH